MANDLDGKFRDIRARAALADADFLIEMSYRLAHKRKTKSDLFSCAQEIYSLTACFYLNCYFRKHVKSTMGGENNAKFERSPQKRKFDSLLKVHGELLERVEKDADPAVPTAVIINELHAIGEIVQRIKVLYKNANFYFHIKKETEAIVSELSERIDIELVKTYLKEIYLGTNAINGQYSDLKRNSRGEVVRNEKGEPEIIDCQMDISEMPKTWNSIDKIIRTVAKKHKYKSPRGRPKGLQNKVVQ